MRNSPFSVLQIYATLRQAISNSGFSPSAANSQPLHAAFIPQPSAAGSQSTHARRCCHPAAGRRLSLSPGCRRGGGEAAISRCFNVNPDLCFFPPAYVGGTTSFVKKPEVMTASHMLAGGLALLGGPLTCPPRSASPSHCGC